MSDKSWLHLLYILPLDSYRYRKQQNSPSTSVSGWIQVPSSSDMSHVSCPNLLGTLKGVPGKSKLCMALKLQQHMCYIEGNNHFSWPADYTLAISAQYITGHLPGSPSPSLQNCFLHSYLDLRVDTTHDYPLRCHIFHLHFLNFMRFSAAHFFNLSSSLWIEALPSTL